MRIGIALGIALVAGCGAAERPSVHPPSEPDLRVLWDRALDAEQARSDALALMIGELEVHAGRLRVREDRGAGATRDAAIDEEVLAVRDPAEGSTLAIFGAHAHFRMALDGTPIARASAVVPHGAPSESVAECVDCVVLGSGRIAIDGTFRGTRPDGAPFTLEARGVLERTALSQLGERQLETRFAPALAQRGLDRFHVRGSTLAIEADREALGAPVARDGEECTRVLAYRVRIEVDLRVLARRTARIVSPPRAFDRCCELSAGGTACRERPIER